MSSAIPRDERVQRMLARLTIGASRLDAVTRSTGDTLSWSDIAAGVAFIRRRDGNRKVPDEYRQALLYYMGGEHLDQLSTVQAGLRARMNGLASTRPALLGWLARARPETLDRFAKVALEELRAMRQCVDCQSQGRVWVDGRAETCPNCWGTGWLAWSMRRRAEAYGMSPGSGWKKGYQSRYESVLTVLHHDLYHALLKLMSKL